MEDKSHILQGGNYYGGAAGKIPSRTAAAPFVEKTYRMVDDPATDALIAWGRESNSFVVVDPFGFAQHLLPSHFKHSNFSSFVRQLNTYGFRKVDPDRWEFAHESFLRGQIHLLHRIVRRNNSGHKTGAGGGGGSDLLGHRQHHGASKKAAEEGGGQDHDDDDGDGDDNLVVEVVRLKQEQKAVEEEVRSMWRRVQETERKPKQMMAFLAKVVQNPQLLPRLQHQASSFPSSASSSSSGQLPPPDGGDDDVFLGDSTAGKRGRRRRRRVISGSSTTLSPSSGDWLGEGDHMLLGLDEGPTYALGVLDSMYPSTLNDDGLPVTNHYPFVGEDAGMLSAAHFGGSSTTSSALLPEFVGGGAGLDMDAAAGGAAAAAATYGPFVMPTNRIPT